MDNDLKLWQALVMAARAFADTLEANLSASAETAPESEEEVSAEAEPTGDTPANGDSLTLKGWHESGKNV